MSQLHVGRNWIGLGAVGLAIAMLFTGACSGPVYRISDREQVVGTDDELDRKFHFVAIDTQGIGLRFPGYLLGIEKAERERIGLGDDAGLADEPWIDTEEIDDLRKTAWGETIVDGLESRFDDGERTFVSHIVRTSDVTGPVPRVRSEFLYNVYAEDPAVPGAQVGAGADRGAYAMSYEALDLLEAEVRERIEADGITHVVVCCMGWNTSQERSVRNFNALYGHLLDAAGSVAGFKPLFIGVTWPSLWDSALGGSSPFSYDNKANDADEIGASWVNLLVNRVLPGDGFGGDPDPVKVICIGHSFGARVVSRAAFSHGLVEGGPDRSNVDALVLLQGALSMNRFLPEREKGKEGAPYRGHRTEVGLVALTWSEHDEANPFANYVTGANHLGGRPGYERAKDYECTDRFAFRTVSASGSIEGAPDWRASGRVLVLDASQIVRFNMFQSGGGAHSDIYTPEMGRLVWELIREL